MSDLALFIKNLNKIYQKSSQSKAKQALKSINLEVKKGSFFGLLGPNGAGKSTIINILAGLVNKTSGQIEICGIDIDKDQTASKMKIGIVPQELIIDPFFTVYETLEIYAGYFGVKKSERRTDEIIVALGLKDKAKNKPRSLSGGMRRRLLVAKALVHNPQLLVLDEPTAGVDVELRHQLWNYIKKLNSQGTTILLTTHYLQEAEELCDQIAVIDEGEVVANDTKENLMSLLNKKELIIKSKVPILVNLEEIFVDLKITRRFENEFSITYDPKKIEIEKILDLIAKNNLQIKDISTKEPHLEEVFKYLTS
jgi:ABC-2 type transport system ATP-binding protein